MLSTPNSLAAVAPPTKPERKIKIGGVARHFNISVDLLRLYEREGLLIPIKSSKGTRYYTERDYPWIETLMRLVRDYRLNFAGVRHLLAFCRAGTFANVTPPKETSAPLPQSLPIPAGFTTPAVGQGRIATNARSTGRRRHART